MNRAIAGLTKGRRHAAMPMKNSGLLKLLFIINAFLHNCYWAVLRISQQSYKKSNVSKNVDLISF